MYRVLLFAIAVGMFAHNLGADEPSSLSRTVPLAPAFEVNNGQYDPRVKFAMRANGYSAFLTQDGVALALSDTAPEAPVVWLRFANGRQRDVKGRRPIAESRHYIRRDGTHSVSMFAEVVANDVYQGTDVLYRVTPLGLEFDVVLEPNADPSAIALEVNAPGPVTIARDGDLQVQVGRARPLIQRRPIAYQTRQGVRVPIDARYELDSRGLVRFILGAYDKTLPLTIDPALSYATLVDGDRNDVINDVFIDSSNYVYVTGVTESPVFPTSSSAVYATHRGRRDAFVAKFAPDGARVLTTYLGGTDNDTGFAVTADGAGNIYVAGTTFPGYTANATNPGPTFPFTQGAYKTYPYPHSALNQADVFIAKLNPTGSTLVFAAHVAGRIDQIPRGIAVDANANVYVAGETASSNSGYPFPTTAGALQRQGGATGASVTYDFFILKLDSTGAALIYSTLLGGAWNEKLGGFAVDSTGAAWIGGTTTSAAMPWTTNAHQSRYAGPVQGLDRQTDAYLAKVSADGRTLLYATYLGGNGVDAINDVNVDIEDNVYVAGRTTSSDFPVTQNPYSMTGSGFFGKLSAGGDVKYISRIPGSVSVEAVGTNAGIVYLAGDVWSTDLPLVTPDDNTFNGGQYDAFVMRFGESGANLEYSTYLGGTGIDQVTALAVDAAGNVIVVGYTTSANFPTTATATQSAPGTLQAGFIAKYVFDTDGDGLLDAWETSGIDANGDGTIDLTLPNADPRHKDLYVEVDYMEVAGQHTHRPDRRPDGTPLPADPLQNVANVFATAPVNNPDNQPGVTLHVVIDEQLQEQTPIRCCGTGSDFDVIKRGSPPNPCTSGKFGTQAERSANNCQHVLAAKRLAYRYSIFGHNHSLIGSGGVAEYPGNDLAITLRVAEQGYDYEDLAQINATRFGTTFDAEWSDIVAGTFMHEFGHTLGLNHGGGLGIREPLARATNFKPNYLSVMNYSRTYNEAAPNTAMPSVVVRTNRALDYSRSTLPTLAEGSLSEPAGVGGPPASLTLFAQGFAGTRRVAPTAGAIDWNGQNAIETAPVSADINYFAYPGQAATQTPSPNETLEGHDDWAHLTYSFRASAGYRNGPAAMSDADDDMVDVNVSSLTLGTSSPTVILTAPSDGERVSAGASVTLTATASDADGIVAVELLNGSTTLHSAASSPVSFQWIAPPTGTHMIAAQAKDSVGGMARTKFRTIHVGCAPSLNPGSAALPFTVASGSFSVSLPSACAWAATPTEPWVQIPSAASGNGNGTIDYVLDANTTSSPRTATIGIAGATFVVTQAAAPTFGAPANVVATASANLDGPFVAITWTEVSGGVQYEVARSADGVNYTMDGFAYGGSYVSTAVSIGRSYLFKVRAIDSNNTSSAYSAPDLATVLQFTDDPLLPGVTPMKSVHITELRTAIDSVRILAGIGSYGWLRAIAPGMTVEAAEMEEMRSALNQARSALALQSIAYTDVPLISMVSRIKAAHLTELRGGVR